MKIFYLLFFLFFTVDLYSQCLDGVFIKERHVFNQEIYDTLLINDKTFFVSASKFSNYNTSSSAPDTSLIDGTWLVLQSNDPNIIMMEVSYLNGKRNGSLICKDSTGKVLEKLNYKNGFLNGIQTTYHFKNESISYQDNYSLGKRNGKQYSYFENGQLSSLQNFIDGKKDGQQLSYWKDGTLTQDEFYIQGIPHGTHKKWHRNGKPKVIRHYDNGRRIGTFYEWDEMGRIREYVYFNNNIPIGVALGFNEGKLSFERYFKNGQLVREVYDYYTVPKKYFKIKYDKKKKGKYDLSQIENVIKEEIIIIIDDTIRIIKKYYESGQLKSEEPEVFYDRIDCRRIYHKIGSHKFWSKDGFLQETLIFKNDSLIETKKN